MIRQTDIKPGRTAITDFTGCQIPCVPKITQGQVIFQDASVIKSIKRSLAYPWNNHVKKWLKRSYYFLVRVKGTTAARESAKLYKPDTDLRKGDTVRVRSKEEILSTLDPFKELRGCAFLPDMFQYCGTTQIVFRVMEHFMDERDYKLKKTRGVILLENVFCNGTPAFGICDRCCFLFWREEWLEKIK